MVPTAISIWGKRRFALTGIFLEMTLKGKKNHFAHEEIPKWIWQIDTLAPISLEGQPESIPDPRGGPQGWPPRDMDARNINRGLANLDALKMEGVVKAPYHFQVHSSLIQTSICSRVSSPCVSYTRHSNNECCCSGGLLWWVSGLLLKDTKFIHSWKCLCKKSLGVLLQIMWGETRKHVWAVLRG